MRKILSVGVLLIGMLIVTGCQQSQEESSKELFISAASSLMDVSEEVKKEFAKEYPDVKLVFNYGASNKLAVQIRQGAPVDVFLSANQIEVERLIDDELVLGKDVSVFAGNSLVLASGKMMKDDATKILSNYPDVLAIAEPNSVPLGKYSKAFLTNAKLWDSFADRMVYAKDARQVVSYLESGEVKLGIIYLSDAKQSTKLAYVKELPPLYGTIEYPAAILKDSKNAQQANQFVEFLLSAKGQKILESYGFVLQ